MAIPIPTRDEAILYLVSSLSRLTVDAGAELSTVIGAEAAADLTLDALEAQQVAFEVLGVTEDDVRRVAEAQASR